MIKYKVIIPFIHKGKVYKSGEFFNPNNNAEIFKYISARKIVRIFIDEGKKIRKPSIEEIIKVEKKSPLEKKRKGRKPKKWKYLKLF